MFGRIGLAWALLVIAEMVTNIALELGVLTSEPDTTIIVILAGLVVWIMWGGDDD